MGGIGGTTSLGGSAGDAGASGSGPVPVVCGVNELGSFLGTTASELGSGVGSLAACAGSGPEAIFHWQAPRTGSYRIDTLGSEFDTVLTVSSLNPCAAAVPPPEQCNDDFAGQQSLLVVQGEAGSDLFIRVDSWRLMGGHLELNIREAGECPLLEVADLVPGEPFELSGFDRAAHGLSGGGVTECNGATIGLTVLWRAPASGTFEFSTAASDFDTVLAIRDGCGGTLLGCNDDAPGDNSSRVQATLSEGQSIVLEVAPFLNALTRPMNTLRLRYEQLDGAP